MANRTKFTDRARTRETFQKISANSGNMRMGGFGSGGHNWKGRGTVGGCRSLDVNELNKMGALVSSFRGGWRWSYEDGTEATIGLRMKEGGLVLSYRYRRNGSEWEDVEQPAPITWEPCRYGGRRPYFRCPGVVTGVPCGRRTLKLYGAGRCFLCRHCYGLVYQSQHERGMDRVLRRANKIRVRLGGDSGTSAAFPDKPKGMHWRSYERLCEKSMDAEEEADEYMALKVARLMRRFGSGTARTKRFWA